MRSLGTNVLSRRRRRLRSLAARAGGWSQPFGPNGVRIAMTHAEHDSEYVWHNPETRRDATPSAANPAAS